MKPNLAMAGVVLGTRFVSDGLASQLWHDGYLPRTESERYTPFGMCEQGEITEHTQLHYSI